MKYNKGYTLLFSILVATIVLGVAIFILDVSRKQYELSVAARNSIYSFYAADSGIECAVNGVNWAASNGFSSTSPSTLSCAGNSVTMTMVPTGSISIYPTGVLTAGTLAQQSGYISLDHGLGGNTVKPCIQVIITTGRDSTTGEPTTIIDSRGYNLCVVTGGINPTTLPDVSNPGTVERALRLIQAGVW